MFAQTPLSFQSEPLPANPTVTLSFASFAQIAFSTLFLFNYFHTLLFSISDLFPFPPIASALLHKKPLGRVPVVQPIAFQSYVDRSLLFAFNCRLSAFCYSLLPNSFPCHSYAKTGGYPYLVIPFQPLTTHRRVTQRLFLCLIYFLYLLYPPYRFLHPAHQLYPAAHPLLQPR